MIYNLDTVRDDLILDIGIQGEDNARQVKFDISAWLAAWPGGTIEIQYKRPEDTGTYDALPSKFSVVDGILTWIIDINQTVYGGYGYAIITYRQGGVVRKSPRFNTLVKAGLPPAGPAPDAVADWIAEANTALSAIQSLEFSINADGELLAGETILGRVSDNPRGDYNPSADPLYSKRDVVFYNGGSYRYINDTPSNEPTSSASHWQQIASIGGQDLVDAAVAARDAATAQAALAQGYAAQLAAGLLRPKGTYADLAALNAGTPTVADTDEIYITLDDGKWCYHNGTAWVAGGAFQAADAASFPIADAGGYFTDDNVEDALQEVGFQLAEMAKNEYLITNLLVNPFPTTDTTGWSHYSNYSTESIVDGWLRSTKAANKPYPYQNGAWAIPAGHVLYVALNARANKATTMTLNLTKDGVVSTAVAVKYLALTTSDQRFAFLMTPTDVVNFFAINMGFLTADGDYVEIKNVVMIDMTAEFGAGYEKQSRVDAFLAKNYPLQKCFAGPVPYTTAKAMFGDLEFSDNFWKGKKIWWCGTSIPATAFLNGYNYPSRVADILGATVYNEALSGTGAHIRQLPGEWNGGFPAGMQDLAQTRAEKQAIIDDWANQYTKFTGAPSTLTGAQITAILDSSYETKLLKYLQGGSVGRCDLYVFDHGYNDGTGSHPVPADPYDRTTFIGALNFLVRTILNDNPRARIVFIGHYENDKYPGVVTAQQYVASYWKFPICPLWERLGWTQRTLTTTGYWTGSAPNYTWVPSGGASQTLTMKQIALADDLHPHTDSSGAAVNLVASEIAGWLRTVR